MSTEAGEVLISALKSRLMNALLKLWKMSSNCSLVTGPVISASSSLAEICGCADLPLTGDLLILRGRKILYEHSVPHTQNL